MLRAVIVGASGYAGAEIARYIHFHPHVTLEALVVSDNSADRHKLFSDNELHPHLKGLIDLPLQGLSDYRHAHPVPDMVFLATDAPVSHDLVPYFLEQGSVVFDLSGAFRLPRAELYPTYYHFTHQYPHLLKTAVYGLAEWNGAAIKNTNFISLPGCYPTAAQLALRPLLEKRLLDTHTIPMIYALSGVSGAGRKAHLSRSFCEVSVQAYSLLEHRHQPEIAAHLGRDIVFMPHLGNFKRGIYQTIAMRVRSGVSRAMILDAFHHYYHDKPLIRVYESGLPALKNVVGLPYCDIGYVLKQDQLIVVATEDNLLKGAAAQAVQCMNIRYGFEETVSLL